MLEEGKMITNKPTLQQFFDDVAGHDWFHEMSDDHSVYSRGEANWKRLTVIANTNGPGYVAILNAWRSYHYSGLVFGSEKKPKPIRPD